MAAHKLTLSVDAGVVEAAKRYAAQQGTSVSHLVEEFLATVSSVPPASSAPPVLSRLRGSLKDTQLDEAEHQAYLAEKYR